MDLTLEDKVAWVSGGSGGIGRAVAAALAAEGARVAISGRSPDRLAAAAAELSRTDATVLSVVADTRDRAAVDAAAARIVAELGEIDILVNGAGAPGGKTNGPLAEVSDAALLADLDEKYVGYLRCARAAAPAMRRRGGGAMVHIGGMSARESGTYSAGGRNIAVVHLSKTLADELGPDGITSNVVHPAMTLTPWFAEKAAAAGRDPAELAAEMGAGYALGRLMGAEEVADVICFLASPRAIAITGETIAVGGGSVRGVSP